MDPDRNADKDDRFSRGLNYRSYEQDPFSRESMLSNRVTWEKGSPRIPTGGYLMGGNWGTFNPTSNHTEFNRDVEPERARKICGHEGEHRKGRGEYDARVYNGDPGADYGKQ